MNSAIAHLAPDHNLCRGGFGDILAVIRLALLQNPPLPYEHHKGRVLYQCYRFGKQALSLNPPLQAMVKDVKRSHVPSSERAIARGYHIRDGDR